jgi:hypothetical protein|tara:strand:+ start:1241 stop:1936 length:696 start_codon:yes stop_codon:yes gene_type:complete
MKRSEVLKEIVKQSYSARSKALHEADKETKFSPATVAPTAAAASAPAPSSAGASSSGGNSTRINVPVLTLRIKKADLKLGKKVLILPSKLKKEKWQDDVIGAVTNSKESADKAIAADPTLEEEKKKALERVPDSDLIYEKDPFGDGYEKEEIILKEPIFENEDLRDVVVMDRDGEKEQVLPCREGDAKCKEANEAYDLYEVKVDDPDNKGDFKLVQKNNEEVMADGTIASK